MATNKTPFTIQVLKDNELIEKRISVSAILTWYKEYIVHVFVPLRKDEELNTFAANMACVDCWHPISLLTSQVNDRYTRLDFMITDQNILFSDKLNLIQYILDYLTEYKLQINTKKLVFKSEIFNNICDEQYLTLYIGNSLTTENGKLKLLRINNNPTEFDYTIWQNTSTKQIIYMTREQLLTTLCNLTTIN